MRIDTFRNRLAATRLLLDKTEAHLTDLHALAYDRPRAVAERVNGGTRDYALDTHGDPRARAMWERLSLRVTDSTEDLAVTVHEVLTFLSIGPSPSTRRDTSADCAPAEIVAALEAQARRRQEGEYTPEASMPQPKRRTIDYHSELMALRAAVAKTAAAESRKGTKLRPPKGRLTPKEQDAWARALGQPTKQKQQKQAS